ncbi:RNA polymerase sigma-70 factor, ECF subfamily [Rhizobium sp. NFR07]|uniref:RNA polymerase sigma factor n=1 Tax=Rhizobium sp. NFR07 TaxID=1566262 RepID=UPI0008E72BFB|nr:sigma-70 family RNA polymerase sigma factor [Rhizobium sp. NFR07]SFB32113.1 RNA polymerase sigma-70 factor, ECF subfamily [Rhizobium sp. NFR07]
MSVEDDIRKVMYAAHRATLVSYAASFIGSRDEAEEVVQEAFTKLRPDSLNNVESPIAYLRTMVRNLAINRRRRQRYELEQATEHAPEWIQPLRTPSPEQQTVNNDQMRLLATALQALPDKARMIVEMHRFDGYTLQEIANRLDMSVTSVHRALTSAMASLAKQLNAGFK